MVSYSDLSSGFATDRGRTRKNNQDSLGRFEPVSPDSADCLFVVCDGMGGHQSGEIASKLAVEEIARTYAAYAGHYPVPELLEKAVQQAHAAIRAQAVERSLGDTGTTAVVGALHEDTLHIANVSDSRAYLLRGGELRQITRDHSRVAEMVRAQVFTTDEARESNVRNVITRSLSAARDKAEPEFIQEDFLSGDVLVLCTDGLWGPVENAQIRSVVSRLPPQAATDALIKFANRAGGPDNVSVIVVRRGPLPKVAEDDTGEFETVRLPSGWAESVREWVSYPVVLTALIAFALAAAVLVFVALSLFGNR